MGQLRPVHSSQRDATVLSMTEQASLPLLDEAGVRDQLLAFARDLNRIYHKNSCPPLLRRCFCCPAQRFHRPASHFVMAQASVRVRVFNLLHLDTTYLLS